MMPLIQRARCGQAMKDCGPTARSSSTKKLITTRSFTMHSFAQPPTGHSAVHRQACISRGDCEVEIRSQHTFAPGRFPMRVLQRPGYISSTTRLCHMHVRCTMVLRGRILTQHDLVAQQWCRESPWKQGCKLWKHGAAHAYVKDGSIAALLCCKDTAREAGSTSGHTIRASHKQPPAPDTDVHT